LRSGDAARETLETKVRVTIGLDGSGESDISTGVAFFDHMLAQIARHGMFDLKVEAEGDLEIDSHHTVEDVGIVLGEAIDNALGDRRGISRMADATVPMDEALAQVAVDLSGRGHSAFDGDFKNAEIGDLESELIPHFVDSLARNAGANVHVRILAGNNDHHRCEAAFKALGRALDTATALDPRRAGQVPSTKGTITE
jgi:imidazoleglycerol-phosphate dehydratase